MSNCGSIDGGDGDNSLHVCLLTTSRVAGFRNGF